MPDRLPGLIVLVGFWIPQAVAGWVAPGFLERSTKRNRALVTYAVLGDAWDAYIWIDNADALNTEFTSRGVKITRNGYRLCFGQAMEG